MDIAKSMVNGQGIVLMMVSPTVQLPPMTWIADSGASTCIMNEECGLYKKRCVNKPISLGNGKVVHATIVGKLDIAVVQAGCRASFMIKHVQYILCFYTKKFSLMVAMTKGCSINAQTEMISVKKGTL